jgi:PAS domain S-box-containing protein
MAKIITISKNAGQVFQDNPEKLCSLLDALPVCISYIDREQRYHFNNKTYEEWFGISQKEIEGKHIREVLGEKTYESVRGYIENALSGHNESYQTELTLHDGRTIMVVVSVIPHMDQKGDVEGCYVHVTDISESLRIDDELKEAKLFMELIFCLSANFINIPLERIDHAINDALKQAGTFLHLDRCSLGNVSPDGKEMVVTHAWNRGDIPGVCMSYTIERFPWLLSPFLTGKDHVWSKAEGIPKGSKEDISLIEKSGIQSFAGIPVRIDGELKACMGFSKTSDPDPFNYLIIERFHYLATIFGNALSRKNAARRVEESQERLLSFMYNSPAFMYLKDNSGKHLFANRSLLDYFNVSLDEFVGTTAYEYLPDNVARMIEEKDREVIEKGCPLEIDDYNAKLSDRVLYVKEIKFPVRSYEGELAVGGIIIDVTSLKQKEDDLRKAYDEIKLLKERIEVENIYLRDQLSVQSTHKDIIGKSDAMKYVLYRIKQVAPSDATVLILGETGTGKELVAEAIHNESSRRNRSLVKVNCAALPSNLIESELFGREKGAFTGSQARQMGRFELADKGTLFLDEVGELPLDLQAKLLRVIQSGEFERLGSPHTKTVDVRIIASTNRDLIDEVKEGRFREDLYYRLNVFPITVPPLRKRKEDIPMIVKHFLKKFEKKIGKQIGRVPYDVIKTLQDYHWPGNVRELENIIERSMIISPNSTLHLADTIEISKTKDPGTSRRISLSEIERDHILQILEQVKWKIEGKNGAAKLLDLNPSTLRSRMRKLGIQKSV